MKKILIIALCGLRYEGITSVILNYATHISLESISIDFAAPNTVEDSLKEKFKKIGNVYELSSRKKNIIAYTKDLHTVLKRADYDVIHIHGNSGTMLIEVGVARLCGIRKIITHCHSTSTNFPKLNKIMSPVMKFLATDLIACSENSGKWLYHNSAYTVLNNAVDIEKFKFSSEIREKMRKQLNIEDNLVIGHIGNFYEPKNHKFLLEIFEKLHDKNKNTRLLLIGDGQDRAVIEESAKEKKLFEAVVFMGSQSDPSLFYQAMDVFVMPSKWEGLPVVMLEAQAAGLPLLVSDVITKEAGCSEHVYYKSIEQGSDSWAEAVAKIASLVDDRNEYSMQCQERIRRAHFDINQEANILETIYLT